MGLNELQGSWKGETRRLLWLMAAVFITVTLFQYIELPRGTSVLSIFSIGKLQLPAQNNSSVLITTDSASLPVGLKANYSVSERVVAPELDGISDPLDSPPLDDVKDQLNDYKNHSSSNTTNEDFALAPGGEVKNFSLSPVSPPISQSPPPMGSVSAPDNNGTRLSSSGLNLTAPVMPIDPNSSLIDNGIPPLSPPYQIPVRDVYTLADMDQLLAESRWATHSMAPRWSSKVDQELVHAKSEIENAAPSTKDLEHYGPIYRNVTMFRRSYELMEQTLKVYVYKEGDRPVFHKGPLEGIYASEGWFMKLMESNKHFVTRDPRKAHIFYIPFSSRNLEEALYVPNSHTNKNLIAYLKKYLDIITGRYGFWNRTEGADHFLVACHDWRSIHPPDFIGGGAYIQTPQASLQREILDCVVAPSETRRIMSNCIRAMCNADVKEGFKLGKDVSLPETYIPNAKSPLRGRGGKPPSKRRILAFFAGQMHGYLRPILLHHWQNVDRGMKIFGTLPHAKGNKNYIGYMQSSKYCICARGYEVNSPRVVEAIFYECVPVIISDNFVPPFFETLNWESFAVFVAEKDVPNLKSILEAIPEKTYLRLYMRVKKVQQHFLWRPNPVKYDLFHMILHSIWYNRVFQSVPIT